MKLYLCFYYNELHGLNSKKIMQLMDFIMNSSEWLNTYKLFMNWPWRAIIKLKISLSWLFISQDPDERTSTCFNIHIHKYCKRGVTILSVKVGGFIGLFILLLLHCYFENIIFFNFLIHYFLFSHLRKFKLLL